MTSSFAIILLTLQALSASPAPFVLPWNDSSPGITDFSILNEPIGPTARVRVDTNGHFVANDKRVRFLGVNFAGDSPFMPTNKADAVAGRLAKFGINNVRFHHMDAPWASGGGILRYTSASSRSFNDAQLERLHYLVGRLKNHGIYANMNLLVGREYRSDDGLGPEVTTMDWKDQHILGFFNSTALSLQQEYATRLLTPVNPFTGLSLAHDPAVAFVEIINENGLLQKWYDGGLDGLPVPYAADLQQRWNHWLAQRYPDDTALINAWKPIDQPLGSNLLKNGNFASGTSNWSLEQHAGALATFIQTTDYNNAPATRITTTKVGAAGWHVQFNQGGLTVSNTQIYTLTFAAKADASIDLDVSIMQAHDPWQSIGLTRSVRLTPMWQSFTNTFIGAPRGVAADTATRVNFGGMGTRLGSVWLADIRLQKGGRMGNLPPNTSLSQANIPNVRHGVDGFAGTAQTRRDWLHCLRDLEMMYYDAMVHHVRTVCGYSGLIFGTIMANSPATVQSRLDVIDAHAYWQHPQFPGQPWDSVNWFVPNISMVTTTNTDNTITDLARQRIRGKPFTVTEYQHPSPNYYGAEGPLLLAAYGALQDWDGLWLFDYGPGNDSVGMGRIRGYFDTAQHPPKMANLLLAANLFRRGDLTPLTNEVVMALKPEQELDILLSHAGAWSIFSSGQLGVPGHWAFHTRLSVDTGPNATGLSQSPTSPPPTGEPLAAQWNSGSAGPYVAIDTPRSKAAVGFLKDTVLKLGNLELEVSPEKLPWTSIGLSVVRGETFTNGTFLVIASSWIENTGMTWKDASRNSVGNQWGTSPTLIEVVPFRLTLPVARSRVQGWTLDERGQRKSILNIQAHPNDPTKTVVIASPDTGTLWYEIEVAPPNTASFQQWRQQHFTPEELTLPLISGPNAIPSSDGVPNFVKYALGLVPRPSVAAQDLPSWTVRHDDAQLCLSVQCTRTKSMADARLFPLFTTDLRTWPTATFEDNPISVTDLGTTERIEWQFCQPTTDTPTFSLFGGIWIEPINR